MPDKDNENKFMAMLERMGMVRKLDSDDEPDREYSEPVSRKAQSYIPEKDEPSRSTEIHSDDVPSSSFVTSHQPVPGMPEPVLPEEIPQHPEPPRPRADVTRIDVPAADDFEEPDFLSGMFDEPEPPARKPQSAGGRESTFAGDSSFWNEPTQSGGLPIEAYTDRYLEIAELYEIFSMKTSGIDTIYLIEDYLESLPASLPDDSRREIIIKILAASGFNYDNLMGDGVGRVGKLKEYAEQFSQRTEDYISSRSAELESLERQMQKVRGMIDRRRELHKKQFFTIEAEAQRLKDLLAFLSE